MSELLQKLVLAILFNIALFVVFALGFFVAKKFKKATFSRVIDFQQNFVAFSLSIYIFALLPIYLSCFVWVSTFFVLRNFVFRKNEIRKNQIYKKSPEPKIASLSQIRDAFFPVEISKPDNKDFKYSFLSYSNTGAWLILFLFLEIVKTTKPVNLLFFIESILLASVAFILIGRLVYYITFSSLGSVNFGSEIGTHLTVVLFGIQYYTVVILILISIHGTALFRF